MIYFNFLIFNFEGISSYPINPFNETHQIIFIEQIELKGSHATIMNLAIHQSCPNNIRSFG